MATAAGFTVTGFEEVSRRVARTWTICAGRLIRCLLTDREARRVALGMRHRGAIVSIPRLILAYRTGAMRYGIFMLVKSGETGPVPGQGWSTEQRPA